MDELNIAEKVKTTGSRNARIVVKFIITVAFAIGILVPVICNLAISGGLTWSWYPIMSIIFAWLIIMPPLHFGKKPIKISLISLSITIFLYLFGLDLITEGTSWFWTLGFPIAAVSIAYLWGMYYLFTLSKINKWYLFAIAAISSISIEATVALALSQFGIKEAFSIDTIISILSVCLLSILLVTIGFFSKKKKG